MQNTQSWPSMHMEHVWSTHPTAQYKVPTENKHSLFPRLRTLALYLLLSCVPLSYRVSSTLGFPLHENSHLQQWTSCFSSGTLILPRDAKLQLLPRASSTPQLSPMLPKPLHRAESTRHQVCLLVKDAPQLCVRTPRKPILPGWPQWCWSLLNHG